MRTTATMPVYLQLANKFKKLTQKDKVNFFTAITENQVEDEKSPYNPEFVKKIKERENGKFISMKEYQDLWK